MSVITDTASARCTTQIGGQELCVATGEVARQAGGAVLVRYGDTVVLGTANMRGPLYADGDFLPLLVDYEEKFYAAGKIKGSRFIKREGRPSDEATLVARVIDRSIRPLFPENMINDVQVVVTVLSYDGENDPDIPALIAASSALSVSDVPWNGPIAAVRIGYLDGKFIVNPTTEERSSSELDLIVAGTGEKIMMIEAGANEVSEDLMASALEEAQKALGLITPTIQELATSYGKPKRTPSLMKTDAAATARVTELGRSTLIEKLQAARGKKDLLDAEKAAGAAVQQALTPEERQTISDDVIERVIHELRGAYAREQAFAANWREGGRRFDEIRPISIKVGLLPRTHGSSIFQRGETQILNVCTLGGPADVQWLDTMEIEAKKHYIHHYNFPGYSVGENKPSRGPGRREIGHGALAERALLPVLPPREQWPYTMLLVSEVLESNGSSSMASACASSLSLMDAGVPIKKPVAGIAMGMFTNEQGEYRILTDIAGVEDEQGDMDFKVAGTADGITALQMDIKLHGVTVKMLRDGFAQAKQARLEILSAMNSVLSEARKEMSPYAPRIETIQIPVEKIGDVIGPKGKHINAIIDETGVEIDISDEGLVSITSNDVEAMKKAVAWVKNMTREIQVGERFEGKVTRLMDFGAFVELIPGTGVEGMVHISQFREERVNDIHDVAKVGDVIPVVVTEIDSMGRINLSHIAAVNPNYKPTERRGPRREGGRPRRSGHAGPFRGPRPPR